MCEANAYLLKSGKEHLIMESVDLIESESDNTWQLVGRFGDQKIVHGRIKSMNLVNHKILFEAEEGEENMKNEHNHTDHEREPHRHSHK